LPRTVAIAAVPVTTWLILRELASPGFGSNLFWHDVVGRVTRSVGAPRAHRLLYVVEGIRACWRVVAAAAVLAAIGGLPRVDGERRRLIGFLVCWWLVPIACFSIARTKHEWYVLPSYVPMYVLAAWLIAGALARLRERVPGWPGALAVAMLAVTALAFTSGKTISTLVKRSPVVAAARRRDLDRFLAAAETLGRDHVLALFRPHELQAVRFYLTRDRIAYRALDEAPDGESARYAVVARPSLDALVTARATSRVVAEFPGVALAIVELRPVALPPRL
jgi:hypothetical protein